MLDIDTPHGPARAHIHVAAEPRAALVLGHGAGGSVTAPDLVAVTGVALDAGVSVALVEQPYRVAGRRSTPRPPVLDAAWSAVLEELSRAQLEGLPVIAGGRSSGARVACRTALGTGAVAVLALAFPLQPPRRGAGAEPPSRLPELDGAGVPVLVVQGERDPFGMPEPGPDREIAVVKGDHALKTDLASIRSAVAGWLGRVVAELDAPGPAGHSSRRDDALSSRR